MDRDGFRPAAWLPGPDLQTIVPSFWPGPPADAAVEVRVVRVGPGTSVQVLVARPDAPARGTVLLVHGMGGSADSGYVRRTASEAIARGWAVARMNVRNCGGTEALSSTLYNAGQSEDVAAVLDDLDAARLPRPFAAAGFSFGGNMVLRHAGLDRDSCRADAVAGVNPPVDLDACCTELERPRNFLYQAHFTLVLCRQLRNVRAVRTVPGPEATLATIRSVRRFDALFTAPDAGFGTAEAYYAAASAGPRLAEIRVPALVISAANDPFIPMRIFVPFHAEGRSLRFLHPRRGGHVGYWQSRPPRFWAGAKLLDFFEEVLPRP